MLQRRWNEDVAVVLKRTLRVQDFLRVREAEDAPSLLSVTQYRFRVQPAGAVDAALALGDTDDHRVALFAQGLRRVIADLAKPLHDHSLAGEAPREPGGGSILSS